MANIFRNLIRNEDTFTEGLVNLLDLSSELRSNFYTMVMKNLEIKEELVSIHDFVGNTISTQRAINGPRPDIIVENDSAIIIFEVKIASTTGLTGNRTNCIAVALVNWILVVERSIMSSLFFPANIIILLKLII